MVLFDDADIPLHENQLFKVVGGEGRSFGPQLKNLTRRRGRQRRVVFQASLNS